MKIFLWYARQPITSAVISISLIMIVFSPHVHASLRLVSSKTTTQNITLPQVPRVSAYEAYQKFKAGKAIIVDSHSDNVTGRRIAGAIFISSDNVRLGKTKLPPLPKTGVEIFTYCY